MKNVLRTVVLIFLSLGALGVLSAVYGATDSEVSAMIRGSIQQSFPGLAGNISVDAQNGMVTLGGTVPSIAVANKIEALVRSISSVRQVHSNLTVSAKAATNARKPAVRQAKRPAQADLTGGPTETPTATQNTRDVRNAPAATVPSPTTPSPATSDQARATRTAPVAQPSDVPANSKPEQTTPAPVQLQATRPVQNDDVTLALVRSRLLDQGITTRVKEGTLEGSSGVLVNSKDGIIMISGSVTSEKQLSRIMQTVRSVSGVKNVVSNLRVQAPAPVTPRKPVEPQRPVAPEPIETEDAVEPAPAPQTPGRAVVNKPSLESETPTGGSVNAGSPNAATTGGSPADEDPVPQPSTDTNTTDDTTGTDLNDTLDEQTPSADAEVVDRNAETRNQGGTASDSTITEVVRSKLGKSGITGAENIEVRTENRIVTLSGTVANQIDLDRAIDLVRNITFVKNVVSRLDIQQR